MDASSNPSSLEDLARSYGPPPQNEPVPAPALTPGSPMEAFEANRPSKQDVRVALGIDPEIGEDVEDIDPSQWLQHDDTNIVDYVETRAGRLKIAALDESELDLCRRMATKDKHPGRPQAGKEINMKRLRLWIIAYSLNKAYNLFKQPGELTADLIEKNKKLSGEITMMIARITDLSGYKDEVPSGESSFLSVS